MATAATAHRFDAELYGRIVESGAFEGLRIELIDGAIVDTSPQSPLHAGLIDLLTELLASTPYRLRVQLSLRVAQDSVLEPDLALIDGERSFHAHPTTAALVIEVAVSSRALDLGRKAELYAAAGVPAYWVVDPETNAVHVHAEPGPGGYAFRRAHRDEDVLPEPLAVPASRLLPYT